MEQQSNAFLGTEPIGRLLWKLAIPTVISGMYGMNVLTKYMPFAQTPFGFGIISGIVVAICLGLYVVLKRKKML